MPIRNRRDDGPDGQTLEDSTALKRRAGGYTAALFLILITATAGLTLARRSMIRDPAPGAKTSSQPIVDAALLRASATIPRPEAMSWHELDDPAKGGWATQALVDQTTSQLKTLGKLLNRDTSVDTVAFTQLASDDFVGDPLVPDHLELVYEDDIIRVERNKSDPGLAVATIRPQAVECARSITVERCSLYLGDLQMTSAAGERPAS